MYYLARLINATNLPQTKADSGNLNKILSLVFITLGAFAIFWIVLGGLRLIAARSNPEAVSKARNTIIYALIGLVISASAAAIVNVTIGKVK